MAIGKCPGQDSRNIRPDDITEAACPHCGNELEFWKGEAARRCRKCGKRAPNPNLDLGCAAWCKFGDDCLGMINAAFGKQPLEDKLIDEMKAIFGTDQRRIDHAMEVLEHAEAILASEGGDPLVVKAAAILHDIGIQQAERKHGSNAGRYQEIEGEPIAREVLSRLEVPAEQADHICRIVASHHSANLIDTGEFRIIWDADRLANWDEECGHKTSEQLQTHVEKMFRTETGRAMAEARLERARRPQEGETND